MKAGLKAHLDSLKSSEMKEVIKLSDLRDPVVFHKFVKERKDQHQPIPPNNQIAHAGHHWLKRNPQLNGSADAGEWVVAQWSPTELRWYHSNDLATIAKPLYGNGLMSHWEWKGEVPLPDLK